MAYDIGTARGVIEMEYNGRGVRDAQKDLDALDQGGQRSQRSMNDLSRVAAGAGLAIGAALAVGVNAAANFEQRMSAIGAVSGATAGELEQLRNKALQLGKDTAFSASESAKAMEELVKAGLTVEEVLNGAADATVNLAAAGEVDMATAATIASNAMNQFNLKAEDMANVADKIAGAANASAIDVGDFGMSLSQAGATASLAGVTFDDLAAAIALMGNSGIKGSDAGTALKTMLANLQPTTAKQIGLMEELGLITEDGSNKFFDAKGNMKGLADVSGVLQNALKGQTKAQKLMALETLFGSDAIRAGAILAKNGAKGFNDMADSMGKVKAADVAAARLDNFKGSLEQLKGSLETVAIQVGTPLMNALRVIVDMLTVVIGKFLDLPGPVQEAVAVFAAMLSAGLLLFAAFMKIKAAIAAGSAAMALLTSPVLAVIVAIAALVAAFIYFYKNNEKFRAFIDKTIATVKQFVDDALAKIIPAVQRAIPHIIAAGKAVAEWLGKALDKIIPIIIRFAKIFMDDVLPAIKTFISAGITALGKAWDHIGPKIGPALDALGSFATTLGKILIPIIKVVAGLVIWWAGIFLKHILPAILKVAAVFVSILGPAIGRIIGGIIMVVTGLFTYLKGFMDFIVGVFTGNWSRSWEGIKAMFSGVITAILGIARIVLAMLISVFSRAWGTIKAVAGAVWGAIRNAITAQLRMIWNAVRAIISPIIGFFVNTWNAVKNRTTAIFTGIVNAVRDKVTALMNKVKEIKEKITGFFDGAGDWLKDAGKKIVEGLIGGIDAMADKAKDALGKITKGLGKLIPGSPVQEGALKVLNKGHSGSEMIKMIIDGIETMAPALRSAMEGAVSMASPLAYATPAAGSLAAPRSATPGGDSRRARIVDGELRLDPSGRAFITGVASDEDEEHDDYEDTLGRMN